MVICVVLVLLNTFQGIYTVERDGLGVTGMCALSLTAVFWIEVVAARHMRHICLVA